MWLNLYDPRVPMLTRTHCCNHPTRHAVKYDTHLQGFCARCTVEIDGNGVSLPPERTRGYL